MNKPRTSEQPGLAGWIGLRDAEVRVGKRRGHTATGRALEEAELEQVGLVDVLDRVALLAGRRRDRVQTHRAASELLDDGAQQLVVGGVEATLVHLQQREGG